MAPQQTLAEIRNKKVLSTIHKKYWSNEKNTKKEGMDGWMEKNEEIQSNNSHLSRMENDQKVSHLVATTTCFIVALDVFSISSVSTHFCTLFPCKSNH